MAKTNSNVPDTVKRLLNFSKLAIKNKNGKDIIVPGQSTKKNKNGKTDYSSIKPINFPSDVENAYQQFLQNYSYYQGNSPNNQRFQLYKDIIFMLSNSGIMTRAEKLYTDEIISGKEAGQKIIEIKAKDRKVEKDFYQWLDDIGLDSKKIYQMAHDLVVYGDCFYIHGIDLTQGITNISLIDPFLVKDVICFNISTLGKAAQWFSQNRNEFSRYQSIQQVVDTLTDEESLTNLSLFYQTYTLGYELKYSVDDEDKARAIPPWMMGHCGEGTTDCEFFPFSKPQFISSISLYRNYMTSCMLQDMLRVAAFPKELVTIKGGETLTPMDRLQRIDEVRQFIENITPSSTNKDNLSVGERVYAMEDLFEITIMNPEIDLNSVGDLEMKLDDLILSTGIPDSYLIPSRGAGMGGENASALYFNNKIFQRSIEGKKIALLEGIEKSYRTHLAITEEFDAEETEFELSMPVSNSFYTSDKISQDRDTMDFALEMINSLSQAVGLERGDQIPPDIIKDILLTYMPIEPSVLTNWVNRLVKAEEELPEEPINSNPQGQAQGGEAQPLIVPMDGGEGGSSSKGGGTSKPSPKKPNVNPMKEKAIKDLRENYRQGKLDRTIRECYFNSKKDLGFTNRMLGNKVTVNTTYRTQRESASDVSNYSMYKLLKKEKLFQKKRLLEKDKKAE